MVEVRTSTDCGGDNLWRSRDALSEGGRVVTYGALSQRLVLHRWLARAFGELNYARYWADSENPINCAGALARAIMQAAHARLAHRGVWALNEKRMVAWARLTGLSARFARLGARRDDLHAAIDDVGATVTEIRAEVGLA